MWGKWAECEKKQPLQINAGDMEEDWECDMWG